MTPLERVEEALEDLGRMRGPDSGEAHMWACPTHSDTKPSLAVSEGADGRAVLYCHAGCKTGQVVARLGLSLGDLFPKGSLGEPEAVYSYTDEADKTLFEVVRYPGKAFRQRVPDATRPGGYVWSIKGVRLVPFHLPTLIDALAAGEDVYIVEGEKDVLALENGVFAVATCNSGGAGKWTEAHSAFFAGTTSRVTIVADCDAAGYAHAVKVHDSLRDVAAIEAEIVEPAVGKDAADHISDHGLAAFRRITVEQAKGLAAESGTDDGRAEIDREKAKLRIRETARREFEAEQAAKGFGGFEGLTLDQALAQERKQAPWQIERLLRTGHKATLTAAFKTGKTTVIANLVRSLADGVPFLGRYDVTELNGRVGAFNYELVPDDMLDLAASLKIHHPERVCIEHLRGQGFTLANDYHAETTVNWLNNNEIQVWVLDPFGRALRGFGEENSNDDVRAFLMRLDEIMSQTRVTGVVVPVHTGRVSTEVGAERARGATVIDDDPDVRWILTRDSTGTRYFRAEGRGVDVPEFALGFDPDSRALYATDQTRVTSRAMSMAPDVLRFIEEHPDCSLREVKAGVPGRDAHIDLAVKLLTQLGCVAVEEKGRRLAHSATGEPLPKSNEARGPARPDEARPRLKPKRGPRPAPKGASASVQRRKASPNPSKES